jgi:hypothetical protein
MPTSWPVIAMVPYRRLPAAAEEAMLPLID